MADDIPYMPSVKNLDDILRKIKVAQTPPKFTYDFLQSNLGFTSSNDRAIIKVLKQLGFLKSDSRPTSRYNDFRSEEGKSRALAKGLREGWSEVFLSDKDAYKRTPTELKEILKNVTGKSESVARKMATTFNALCEHADFSAIDEEPEEPEEAEEPEDGEKEKKEELPNGVRRAVSGVGRRAEVALHNDIHVHLPTTSDVAVYTAIFRALREELLD